MVRVALRWILRSVGAVAALLLVLIVLLVGGSGTPPGRLAIERLVPRLTAGEVTILGLQGWLFGRSHIAHAELRDAKGPWLTIDNLTFDWTPVALLSGTFDVRRLAADQVVVARQPLPSGSSGAAALPLRVQISELAVSRLVLAPPVAGHAAALAVRGRAHLDALDNGSAEIAVQQLDGTGRYALDGRIDPDGVHATLHLAEPAGGILGAIAGLPEIGAIAAEATLAGPLNAIQTRLAVTAGQLRAAATGTVDALHPAADLTVTASAPAMTPRPDLSWQAVSVQGEVHGSLQKPRVAASVTVTGLTAGTASVGNTTARLAGDAGTVTLTGTLAGIRLPGAQPDVLAAAPVQVTADLQLDQASRPLRFHISHQLFDANGTATLAGSRQGDLRLTVPEVAPLATAGGIAGVAGKLAATLRVAMQGDSTRVAAELSVGLTNGPGPSVALLGSEAHLALEATQHGDAVTLSRLQIDSGAFNAGMQGTFRPGAMDLRWTMALADLAKLQSSVNGALSAQGTLRGAPDNLAVTADVRGTVAAPGLAPGEVTAQVALNGLPNAPSGTLHAAGTLLGAPLVLDVNTKRTGNVSDIDVAQASWKSAHAAGQVRLNVDSLAPDGHLTFAIDRLDDLSPLLGQALRGAINGTLDGTTQAAHLQVTVQSLELPGATRVARAVVDATVRDPTTHPAVDGRIAVDGVAAAGARGALVLTAKGTPDALAVRLTANLPDLQGAPAKLDAAATVNATARGIALDTAQLLWRQQTLRLLAPAHLDFASGVAVDHLRLGLQQAVLEARGKLSPTLDLTARVQDLPLKLASMFDPAITADGTVDANARLTGAPARPSGSVRVAARGVRLTTGPGAAMPAANLAATAELRSGSAQLDLRASAGTSRLTVTGTAGMSGNRALDLRARGTVNLAMTDPLLTPQGRRAGGAVTLDATVTGTAAAPRINGSASLANGSFRDFAQGIDLSAITARVEGDGGTVRLTALRATAGTGTVEMSGQVDLTAANLPLNLHLIARNARPLDNDLLTATVDADVTLQGELTGTITTAGRVTVRRAEIRIPERLPASVAVLNVRVAGAPPAPPPAPGPQIALNLTVAAPEQIFVRGRGVDAELGGRLQLGGTLANPAPSGGFSLRRGQFSLAGQVLTFTTGEISFNGGSLTDPSLNLVANTTVSDVTATLTIGGTARQPKITLSSTPSMPQDEILAMLLYGTRTTSLGPLELAQIAAALASLSGAAPSLSNPLENVRQALGLDRLSVGSGSQLEAGRYVSRRVYVGARQSVTGTGTEAVVQVDLAKGLKLEATAGTAASSTATGATSGADAASVGIKYQFEY